MSWIQQPRIKRGCFFVWENGKIGLTLKENVILFQKYVGRRTNELEDIL